MDWVFLMLILEASFGTWYTIGTLHIPEMCDIGWIWKGWGSN